MSTSNELLKKHSAVKNVEYQITGEGDLRVPVSCSLCGTIADADQNALNWAIHYSKVFTGISLWRKFYGEEKELIFITGERRQKHPSWQRPQHQAVRY